MSKSKINKAECIILENAGEMMPKCYLYKHELTSIPSECTCVELPCLEITEFEAKKIFLSYKKTSGSWLSVLHVLHIACMLHLQVHLSNPIWGW